MSKVKVNDLNMHYDIYGEGEPFIILWGISGEISPFIEQFDERTDKRFKIISFDSRGSGRTDKPDIPYTIEMMAEDTVGLMDAINVKQAHILGISMGSRVALKVAAKYPERVKSLILNVAAARSPHKDDPDAAVSFERLEIAGKDPELLKAMGKYAPTVESFGRLFKALKQFDGTDILKKIKAPTLIINGTNDPSTPVKFAKELNNGISGSKLVLVNEDHVFIRTNPDLLIKNIIKFLDENKEQSRE
jgi:pimeloyl-ACP methyl ester carboxylesterase